MYVSPQGKRPQKGNSSCPYYGTRGMVLFFPNRSRPIRCHFWPLKIPIADGTCLGIARE